MKIDLNSLFSMPRHSGIAFSESNSVQGLYALVEQFYKPHFKMVEVGSFEGVSTLLFANCVDTVYSVDYYDYIPPVTGRIPEHDQLFKNAEKLFISRTKDVPNIIKIRKESREAAKDFENGSLDAVYLDAEHDEAGFRADMDAWLPKIKRGGIISGHDYNEAGIQKVIAEKGFKFITTAPDHSWAIPIPTIDLVAVACTRVPETIEAIKKSQAQFKFTRSILFTHEDITPDGFEVIKIDKLDYKQYNEFIAMKLWQFIGSEYVLVVQNDGYVTDGTLWTEEFLKYDYVGAPWPPKTQFLKDGTEVRVGNGGFSLRSRRLLRAPTILGLEFTDMGTGFWHEDGFLCVHYRKELEDSGIKFAPVEVAAQFSTELTVPETRKSFGGHKYL